MTEKMHTSDPSDSSATEVNSINVPKKQCKYTENIFYYIASSKKLHDADREVRIHQKRSLKDIKPLDNRDPSTYRRQQIHNIETYESICYV